MRRIVNVDARGKRHVYARAMDINWRRILGVAVCAVPLEIGMTIAAPMAGADRQQPVPLYGSTTRSWITHVRRSTVDQTPPNRPCKPQFHHDVCRVGLCAHWQAAARSERACMFDYQWVNDRWESVGEYPFHDDGSPVTTTRSTSHGNPDGSFSGERTFTVSGPGCPGDGTGTYWLPFTLTPTEAPTKTSCEPVYRFTANCSPDGIRTHATAVRGRRPRPLDDGAGTGVPA